VPSEVIVDTGIMDLIDICHWERHQWW
jgi:hypothetical protein